MLLVCRRESELDSDAQNVPSLGLGNHLALEDGTPVNRAGGLCLVRLSHIS